GPHLHSSYLLGGGRGISALDRQWRRVHGSGSCQRQAHEVGLSAGARLREDLFELAAHGVQTDTALLGALGQRQPGGERTGELGLRSREFRSEEHTSEL